MAKIKRVNLRDSFTIHPPTQTIAGVVEVFDDAVTNWLDVLHHVRASNEWSEALIGERERRDADTRDSSVVWISPFDFRNSDEIHRFMRSVWLHIDDYGKRYERGFSGLENVNINRYMPGQQYHIHADAGGKSTRVISALVYLNDDFTGGETEFVHFGERITPKAGRLVIFPSDYAYAHAALPPTDGVKYSAAFWTNA